MNNNSFIAVKSTIQIAEINVEVFKLFDGTFFLNQTQTTNAVKKAESSIRRFYVSKKGKALADKSFTSADFPTSYAAAGFVSAVPIEVVQAYWLKEAIAGNEYAEALISALMTETLERKCQVAFNGVADEKEIAAKAIAAYRETLFGCGNLNNAEYVDLCKECREDHSQCIVGFI